MVSKTTATTNLIKDINKVLQPLDGIENFIKADDRVFIKPNFNTDDPFPASSDLNFIKSVIKIVETQKPKQIILGDSPTYFGNSREFFDNINPQSLLTEFPNLQVVFLNDTEWVEKPIPNGKYFKRASIPKILEDVDKIIYLPCLKTHFLAKYTGAIKLSVGLLEPVQRIKMHAGHLQEKIAEINTLIRPDLIIMDARKCFITKGPSEGELAEPNLILASTNRVELDIEGVKIIQSYPDNDLQEIKPNKLPQISRALELGIK